MQVFKFLILLITFFSFHPDNYQDVDANNDFKNQLNLLYSQEISIKNIALNMSDSTTENNEVSKAIIYQQPKNFKLVLFITLITFLFSIVTFTLYSKQQKHIRKLETSIQSTYLSEFSNEKKEIDIEASIIQNVLVGLNHFETNLEFLEQGVSLIKLSKKLNTNPSYLSKIINTYKKKKFSNYLNDLRINYILSKLKTDKKLSLYTIKAISEETGYSNSQSFTNAFYKKTGIYPSHFIKELK